MLLVGVCILLLPTLKFLNIEFRFLLDAWLVSVWTDDNIFAINRITAKSCYGGEKHLNPIGFYSRNSRESTLNTNTTITNITTMVVPFAPHTAWDLWIRPIGRA